MTPTTWTLYIPDTLTGAFHYDENVYYDSLLPYDCIATSGYTTFWLLTYAN